MSTKWLIVWTFLLIVIAIILSCQIVRAANHLEYTIKIQADGSAFWVIEQRGIGIQSSFDSFRQKVNLILEEARAKTSRNMTAESLSMNESVSGSYHIIRYMFKWVNFSVIENSRIKIGDVFKVENFFENLYGNGEVRIEYPSEYIIESVTPAPHYQDPAANMLGWYGIEDFKTGEPRIIFKEKSSPPGFLEIIGKNWILVIILTALLLSGGYIGVYYYRRHKLMSKEKMEFKRHEVKSPAEIEDAEETILNLLRAAGGTMYQHKIAEACGFSRAKTSKLLKVMESKGIVKRKQKGREKLVTLMEENKK